MAFINDFLRTLALPVSELAKWLETEHQVPVTLTIEKWNELTGMKVIVDVDNQIVDCEDMEGQTIRIPKKTAIDLVDDALVAMDVALKGAKKEIKSNQPILNPKKCQHVYVSGYHKGEQCKVYPTEGWTLCAAHRKGRLPKHLHTRSESEEDTTLKCPYVYVIGTKKGLQCTVKPKTGTGYCSAHKKKGKVISKPKTEEPVVDSSTPEIDNSENPFSSIVELNKTTTKEELIEWIEAIKCHISELTRKDLVSLAVELGSEKEEMARLETHEIQHLILSNRFLQVRIQSV